MAVAAVSAGGRRIKRFWRWTWSIVIVFALSVGMPLVIAEAYRRWLHADWEGDDWGALAISMWLSAGFFGLALLVGRKGQQRAEAVANGTLVTSMGSLAMSSARSFAGENEQALRIAADARAALQHYAFAGRSEQRALVATVEDSYSDLAFGTFSRADALPRSVWDELCHGAAAVQQDAEALRKKLHWWQKDRKGELAAMAANVRFVLRVGQEVRGSSGLTENCVLVDVWRKGARKDDEEPDAPDAERLTPDDQVQRLQCLYRRELTVVKLWDVLHTAVRASPPGLTCSVELLHDLRVAKSWHAPWYVKLDARDGLFKPVNVQGVGLAEAAATDELAQDQSLPLYPEALEHGSVPEGMRTTAIGNLRRLLQGRQPTTVCVLVYDLLPEARYLSFSQRRGKRVVLDGNHRLAAALSIYDEAVKAARTSGKEAEFSSPVRVLAFVISENRPIDAGAADPENYKGWNWRGFTPDIGLIRGTWRP